MAETSDSKVLIKTNYGQIEVTPFRQKAPETVKKTFSPTPNKAITTTQFSIRVIPNLMIQGGGLHKISLRKQPAPIRNEAGNGMHNSRGTLAMARTNDPNSTTSRFFINTVDIFFPLIRMLQASVYAVFGKVINGMDVVDKIKVSTTYAQGMQDVPSQPVIMESVEVISAQ